MKQAIRLASIALLLPLAAAQAQDANYLLPILELENRLRESPFTIIDYRGSRAEGDRTQRITIQFPDSAVIVAKLARAPRGGSTFNNEPRYELAAYDIQKLFLEPDEYAVPPTIVRALPLDLLRERDQYVTPTFDNTRSVVVVLQYWLLQVSPDDFYDRNRARRDTVYARYIGNFNILTHLIRHNDSNQGNFLISRNEAKPRVFTVDNGVAFDSEVSDRGYVWRNLRVERLPRATVERLRSVTPERLQEALGVLVQFEERDGELVAVPRGANLDGGKGVRRAGNVVQFGLTDREIRGIAERVRRLVEDVDAGKTRLIGS